MSAIRLARGYTGRDKFIKFDGNYHGHSDALLVAAGSGLLTLGIPSTPGRHQGRGRRHDRAALQRPRRRRARRSRSEGEQVAAIIVEPVAGNMGVVPPAARLPAGPARPVRRARRRAHLRRGHHRLPRRARRCAGALRRHAGPDHARQDHRRRLPGGRLRRQGRDHGARSRPSAPSTRRARCRATRSRWSPASRSSPSCRKPGVYEELDRKGARLAGGLCQRGRAAPAIATSCNRVGSMSTMFFTDQEVVDWATRLDERHRARTARYFRGMLDAGFTIAPSQFEACFVGLAHTDEDIDAFVAARGRRARGALGRTEPHESHHPRRRSGHAVPAGDQVAAQRDAAGRRQAGHPVRGRGGRRRRRRATS